MVFLYALEADWAALQAAGATVRKIERAGDVKIQIARLGGHELLAAQLGVGQAESAVVAATVLARNRADLLLSTGAVGAIRDEITPGETVVVDQIQNWQAGAEAEAGWREAERARPSILPWPVSDAALVGGWHVVKSASAEVFVASDAERSRLRGLTGAAVVDMNLYGLQKAASAHKLPALHLRVVSDRADGQAATDFAAFIAGYDGRLGRTAAELIRSLGVDPAAPESHPELRALRGEAP